MKYIFKKKSYSFLAGSLDATGYTFRRFFLRKKLVVEPKSILIIRMDHIGDVLLSTSIPRLVKSRYPNARVYFLTSSLSAALLENNPYVDEVLIFDASWFSRKKRCSRQNSSWAYLHGLLRKKKIDLGITLRGDLREILIMKAAGVKNIVGFGITGGGFFLDKEIAYRAGIHETEHNFDVLRGLGIEVPRATKPEIYFSEDENRVLEDKINAMGIHENGRYLGYQIESGLSSKDWPRENAKKFLAAFLEQHAEWTAVLIGAEKSAEDWGGSRVIDLQGKTSLRDLCLLLKKIRLFVGPDSGPSHLASVIGTPTIFLYSGTNVYEQWKPQELSSVIFRRAVPCSPCGLVQCNVEGHPCMASISVEEVLNAVKPILFKVTT